MKLRYKILYMSFGAGLVEYWIEQNSSYILNFIFSLFILFGLFYNNKKLFIKKTDYLLAGEKPGSKYEKAKALNIKIINEEAFEKISGLF